MLAERSGRLARAMLIEVDFIAWTTAAFTLVHSKISLSHLEQMIGRGGNVVT